LNAWFQSRGTEDDGGEAPHPRVAG
jgi:hypothetical protein